MLITATHLTKYNNLKCIVDDVSFTINEQDKVALIGINGTGKDVYKRQPVTIDELKKINGFADIKCEKFGNDIISIIQKYKMDN